MSRPNRSAELASHLARPGRCARASELVASFGYKVLREVVRTGLVVEVVPRVYCHASNAMDFTTRVRAVQLWLPRSSVVSGLAALSLAGLAQAAPGRITVVAPRNLHLVGPTWVRVNRTGWIQTREIHSGVMCAPRERAVIDAWVESDRRDRLSVVLEAMRRSNLKGSAVLRELAKMPRVSGRRELIALLNEASDGIESFLEHRAHRTVLNTKDFRDLRRQVKFTALGNNYVVDTYHEASRTVIEFDGAAFHGTKEAKRRDNARDAALATLGLLTLRIGYDDVMSDPLRCREIIRRTVASRSRGNGLSATGP